MLRHFTPDITGTRVEAEHEAVSVRNTASKRISLCSMLAGFYPSSSMKDDHTQRHR